MKRNILYTILSVVLIFNMSQLNAQKNKLEYSGFFDSYYYRGPISFTGGIGLTAYRGDLVESLGMNSLAYAFSAGVNYKLWPRVRFGSEFTYFFLAGKDEFTERNISFRSSNMEIDLYGRFYLIDDIVRTARDRISKPRLVKPYILAGVGGLRYKPVSQYDAPPIDTIYRSEGVRYPRIGMVVPVGFGFSFGLSFRVHLVTEVTYRLTFSDYIDDVSQRGNPSKNDGYAMFNIKLQFSPTAPKKKKPVTLPPPKQYDGPKGTETWKDRKEREKSQRPQQHNYYDDDNTEEENQDENQDGNDGWDTEEQNQDNQDNQENQDGNDGWDNQDNNNGW